MENSINVKNQKSSENLRIFNGNVSLHTPYQTQCLRNEEESLDVMIDSTCSSPYVSAPSSPGSNRGYSNNNNNGYFFSAPASPMHYIQSKSISVSASTVNLSSSSSFEFDFSTKTNSISTADELFLNGQIRPMKLSSHLQKPQILTPLIDLENEEEDEESVFLKREGRLRNGSIHRRTRSLSPLRNSQSQWHQQEEQEEEDKHTRDDEEESATTTQSDSASTSRSSSTSSRNSKRWVFLKDFLRSKSEGRGNYSKEKFWNSISFNPVKDKKQSISSISVSNDKGKTTTTEKKKSVPAKKTVKPINGIGKRRIPAPSAHEMLYTSNRAQAEEMKRKTYLPYRQGLLGCLGFSSKGYGAMNVFARSLNTTVSSR